MKGERVIIIYIYVIINVIIMRGWLLILKATNLSTHSHPFNGNKHRESGKKNGSLELSLI